MQKEPSITMRRMSHTPGLEATIRERITDLETYCATIVGCHVVVEPAERHHQHGTRYHVRVEVAVPGETIVVAHDPSLYADVQNSGVAENTKEAEIDAERKDAYLAIHEAFDAARRQLQDYVRRQRHDVKVAVRQPHGRVSQLFPIDEYGFIEAEDGHEVYFQKSSVLKDDFGKLKVGSDVTFAEESGEKGPQASTVRLAHPDLARHGAPR